MPHINEPAYDPLWAACQELGVPLCFHAGGSPKIQMRPGDAFTPAVAAAFSGVVRSVSSIAVVANFLLSRSARPLSQAENRVRRKFARLGRLRNRVCGLSVGGRRFAVGRLYFEAVGTVPAAMLFHLLVRSHESSGAALSRQRKYFVVEPLSAGDIELAQHRAARSS